MPIPTVPSSAIATNSGRRREFLSVVIPAFNEEVRIGETLQATEAWLRDHFERFEILVVNDGSVDGTSAAVEAFGKGRPEIRLIGSATNAGKGASVRKGMLAAAGERILFSDADSSTPIAEVEKALTLIGQGYDVAIGSRALPDSHIEPRQNVLRETMGKTFNLFVRLLSRLPFRDTQCGFKCYTREAAQAIFSRARTDGFAFDVETLVLARRLDLRAVDFPVRWMNATGSKVHVVRHSAEMIRDLIRIRRNEARGLYGR